MAQPIVLIIFNCQTGDTEKLALAAAVGAVQARGLIRLRRLPDLHEQGEAEDLVRMRKEYVPPAEKDILAADALILTSSPDCPLGSAQWASCCAILAKLRDEGKLSGKIGGTIGSPISSLLDFGLTPATTAPTEPLALGHATVEAVRARNRTN